MKIFFCFGLVILRLVASAPVDSTGMSWEVFEHVEALVNDAIVNSEQGTPLVVQLIRLAFHDAAGEGGVDAVVDMTNPENNGLQPVIDILDPLYHDAKADFLLPPVFSKADFYAWAYMIALRYATTKNQGAVGDPVVPDFPIRWGRVDVIHPPPEHFPPNGRNSTGTEILKYFREEFQFDDRDAAALMGIHPLALESGFDDGTLQPSILGKYYFSLLFDNAVHFAICGDTPEDQFMGADGFMECAEGKLSAVMDILFCERHVNGCWNVADDYDGLGGFKCDTEKGWRCHGWEQVRVPSTGEYQWRHGCTDPVEDVASRNCRGLFLNADIGLFRAIDEYLDSTNGRVLFFPDESECALSQRPLAKCYAQFADDAYNAMAKFSRRRDSWIFTIAGVFERMMFHGSDPSVLPLLERPTS